MALVYMLKGTYRFEVSLSRLKVTQFVKMPFIAFRLVRLIFTGQTND